MNQFSASKIFALSALAIALLLAAAGAQAAAAYKVRYEVRLDPDAATAEVSMAVQQPDHRLRRVRFSAPAGLEDLRSQGQLTKSGDDYEWFVPATGGRLSWTIAIGHRRSESGYDAWLGPEYGLFRAEDVIPRMATTALRGASSEVSLRVSGPGGWSVITQYPEVDGQFVVRNAARRFDQPGGWILAGKLGIRRDTIANVRVAVAAPVGHGVRRLDILALLAWTLPELARVLPELPERLTIVSAADPMWRGGLSAPESLYLHASRPLISENGTSTLLHEIMHVALGFSAVDGFDWIVEGVAEYYTQELLRRSESISERRFVASRKQLADWAKSADSLCAARSSGARTALAVGLFARLDKELRNASRGSRSLDDLVATLQDRDQVSLSDLQTGFETLTGQESELLHRDDLPGCRNI